MKIPKKNKKLSKLKFLLFFIITIFIYTKTLSLLNKINLDIKNDKIFKILISNSSTLKNNLLEEENTSNIISLDNLLNNNIVVNDKEIEVNKEEIKKEEELVVLEEQETSNEPIVYIYNTHQTETYSTEYLTEYTITPNIMIASYMLKEELEKYNIYSYVEEESIKEVLNANNWKYSKSYKVSRSFIEKRQKELPTIKYYIDLHRDSVGKKYTTIQINDLSYARIMILVGLDHDNYKENLKEAETINNIINEKYPGLSRGIYKKSGKGVNGIYNQDYSKYVFLFEIGGVDNNISEINNTIKVLAEILSEYLKKEGV